MGLCLWVLGWGLVLPKYLAALTAIFIRHIQTSWDAQRHQKMLSEQPRISVEALSSPACDRCVLPQVVDFTEAMSARQLLFWRALFEELLGSCASAAAAEQLFAKFGGSGLATVRSGLILFLRRQFGPWLAAKHTDSDDMLEKLQAAEAGLEQAALQ